MKRYKHVCFSVVQFLSLTDFFFSDCDTHYVNIFDGPYSVRTDPALQTLCGQPKTEELVFFSTGPAMVVEFISGSLTPPYDYLGFQGTVLFGNLPPGAATVFVIKKVNSIHIVYRAP